MSGHGGYPLPVLVTLSSQKYICNICSLIFREPVQSSCGHRFCKSCLETVEPQTPCRGCQEDDEETLLASGDFFPDPAIGRELGREAAQCPNKGCPWTGKFRQYIAHEAECDYVKIKCKCGAELSRDEFAEHETSKCPMRACPFGCESPNSERHQQEAVSEHSRILLEKVEHIQEALRGGGRGDGGGLAGIEAMMSRVSLVEKTVDELKHKLDRGTLPTTGNHEAGGAGQGAGRQSAPPPLARGGTPRADVAAAAGGLTTASRWYPPPGDMATASSEPFGDQGSTGRVLADAFPFPHPSVGGGGVVLLKEKLDTVEALAAVLNREVEQVIVAHSDIAQQSLINKETIAALQTKVVALERGLALKDVSIAEKELRLKSIEKTSYDGTIVWCITDIARKRQDAIQGRTPSIYSPVFYTGRAGYKVCARIYLNGDGMGKGSHISLFFVVMRGQYDAILPWPFRQKVTLMLLDQNNREHVIDAFRPDPTSSSFRRPQSDMNIASGVPLFCPLNKLEETGHQYVKDDTMFVKMIVDTNGL